MTIDAGGKLEITAKGKYSLTALSIEESAKTTLSITASATGKLKTTGPLTIAGAMVDINPPGG